MSQSRGSPSRMSQVLFPPEALRDQASVHPGMFGLGGFFDLWATRWSPGDQGLVHARHGVFRNRRSRC
jgi:hypothetical protein